MNAVKVQNLKKLPVPFNGGNQQPKEAALIKTPLMPAYAV